MIRLLFPSEDDVEPITELMGSLRLHDDGAPTLAALRSPSWLASTATDEVTEPGYQSLSELIPGSPASLDAGSSNATWGTWDNMDTTRLDTLGALHRFMQSCDYLLEPFDSDDEDYDPTRECFMVDHACGEEGPRGNGPSPLMAHAASTWTPGAHVRFSSLDFTLTTEGKLSPANYGVAKGDNIDTIIENLGDLNICTLGDHPLAGYQSEDEYDDFYSDFDSDMRSRTSMGPNYEDYYTSKEVSVGVS